jgi:hypothetical protein
MSVGSGRRGRVALAAGVVGVLLALTGCVPDAHGGRPTSAEPILRGQWQLVDGTDSLGHMDLQNTFMTLTVGSGRRSSVASPCGTVNATVRGSVGPVWVRVAAVADPGCINVAQVQLDSRFVRSLNHAKLATLTRGRLTFAAKGVMLRFQRARPSILDRLVGRGWTLSGITAGQGSVQRPVPFVGFSSIAFSTREKVVEYSGCTRLDFAIGRVPDGYQASDVDRFGVKCPKAQTELDDLLDRAITRERFTLKLYRDALQIANTSRTVILTYLPVSASQD